MMDKSFFIRFGKYTIALLSQSNEIRDSLKLHFTEYISNSQPNVSVIINDESTKAVSAEPGMRYTYNSDNTNFNLGPDIISGALNLESGKWDISLNKSLLDADNIWIFNRFLCRLFYSLFWNEKNREFDAIIIHSSGVIKDNKGYIFFGPPESGKSTVAHLSRQFNVLNDDMNIVTIRGKHISVEGVPFNPRQLDFFNGKGTLAMISSLHKNSKIKIEKGSAQEIAKKIIPEVFLPLPLLAENRKYAFQYLLSCVKKLGDIVPYYRLYFKKNESFWEIMEEQLEV